MKNIIITAGPTNERLDAVMKITNMSTGALGAIIADEFLSDKNSEIDTLYYISTKNRKNPFWGRGIVSYFLYIKTSWGKIYDINITNNCENFVTLLGKILSF